MSWKQKESSCFPTYRKVWWNMNIPKIDWWSIIEQKNNQSNISEWYPLKKIRKTISFRSWNQSRLFPTCHWLFPTCHLSSCVTQMPLTALFHLLPSTSHRGTPTVGAIWKTAQVLGRVTYFCVREECGWGRNGMLFVQLVCPLYL